MQIPFRSTFQPRGARLAHLAIALAASLGLSVAAQAQVIYVDADLTTGAGDGSNWADAYQGPLGLQAALQVAVPGEDIFVAGGLYRPAAPNGMNTASFRLRDQVDLYGGFQGGEASPQDRPPTGTFPSILSGDLTGNDSAPGNTTAENSFQVVTAYGAMDNVLDGFTIEGGLADGNLFSGRDQGAGLDCIITGELRIRDCTFRGNRALTNGGGAYLRATMGGFSITDCTFEGNTCDALGGGLLIDAQYADLGGSSFQGNVAGLRGGGVGVNSARLWLNVSDCDFTGNRAHHGGGMQFKGNGQNRMDRCRFVDNVASGEGAGMLVDAPEISRSLFANCVFAGNTATGAGGGGAVKDNAQGVRRWDNCTFVQNHALIGVVGGYEAGERSRLRISNSIFWGNVGVSSSDELRVGIVAQWCIVQGGHVTGGQILDSDPLFVDPSAGDYRLRGGSPCIDSGSNLLAIDTALVDAAGAYRLRDDPNTIDTGAGLAPIRDRGAFEFQAGFVGVPSCPGLVNSTGVGASMTAMGSMSVADDDLTLMASSLPPNQFALFLASETAGAPVTTPGSIGTLCLGGAIGRFQNQVQSSGPAGEIVFPVGLTVLPTPFGPVAAAPGETWHFQAWYRDIGAGAPSNFTGMVSIVLQ